MEADQIKALRKEKGLTQASLGELLGVQKSTISNWETGNRNPSGSALIALEKLRDGETVITELSDLEMHLLDQNVQVGQFAGREEYLTESLRYLLQHKSFIPLDPAERKDTPGNVTHMYDINY